MLTRPRLRKDGAMLMPTLALAGEQAHVSHPSPGGDQAHAYLPFGESKANASSQAPEGGKAEAFLPTLRGDDNAHASSLAP